MIAVADAPRATSVDRTLWNAAASSARPPWAPEKRAAARRVAAPDMVPSRVMPAVASSSESTRSQRLPGPSEAQPLPSAIDAASSSRSSKDCFDDESSSSSSESDWLVQRSVRRPPTARRDSRLAMLVGCFTFVGSCEHEFVAAGSARGWAVLLRGLSS